MGQIADFVQADSISIGVNHAALNLTTRQSSNTNSRALQIVGGGALKK
jgi:hypothetical protein